MPSLDPIWMAPSLWLNLNQLNMDAISELGELDRSMDCNLYPGSDGKRRDSLEMLAIARQQSGRA